jgi:peptidyl-prolyl cis-trans isomerase SurA
MFALCSKKEIKVEAAALKEARQQIFMERFQRQSKKYLQELRRGAMIEMK